MGFVDTGGVDLYYQVHGEDGPPILLIPPSGAIASTWGDEFVDGLTTVGRVIAYDRRGYAQSVDDVVYSAAVHTRDAIALLEALTSAPAVVVGTSAGATIALNLAVRRPDRILAVVVHEAPWRALRHPSVSPLATLVRVEWLAARNRHREAADVLLRFVYGYRDGGSAWDAFPERWRRIAREHGRAVVADLHSTLGERPRAEELSTLNLPVVCTYGSRSRAYMRATMQGLADAIPTATLREVPGAAHAVSFDAPDEFVRVVAGVIRTADKALAGLRRRR